LVALSALRDIWGKQAVTAWHRRKRRTKTSSAVFPPICEMRRSRNASTGRMATDALCDASAHRVLKMGALVQAPFPIGFRLDQNSSL
jgi:hypothetical protein